MRALARSVRSLASWFADPSAGAVCGRLVLVDTVQGLRSTYDDGVGFTVADQFGPLQPIMDWFANAVAAAIVGLVVGTLVVAVVRQFPSRPAKLIVD